MSDERKSLIAHVTGRVQGVSFRAWTQEQAEARGLSGWVRNESDGSVKALLSGPARQVDDMVGALHEGPMMSHVEHVETKAAEAPGEPGFGIRR